MKAAVLGANGQLGIDICSELERQGHTVVRLTHDDLELSSESSVNTALDLHKPAIVINTAAMHHVEKCEADPAGAMAVNATGAWNVARWAKKSGARVAYISTDYVFSGEKTKPYIESDNATPLNVYGVSKLAGENLTRVAVAEHFILRVSAIYGMNRCRAKGGLNFVELMLKLASERPELRVVDDEFVSPTPTTQITKQVAALCETEAYGLYHATSEGFCSWYEFAKEIFAAEGVSVRLEKARPGEFPAKVARPKYSVLENEALKRKSLNVFTDWREGLRQFLAERKAALAAQV